MQQAHTSKLTSDEDEITLLDLAVTLAENVKLLLIGPLVVGLVVLGVCFLVPKTYESVAILRGDQIAAQLLTTTQILDATITRLNTGSGGHPEEAREQLRDRITTELDPHSKLLMLTMTGRTPQEAQLTSQTLLQQLFLQSVPKADERVRLEKQLEYVRQRAKTVEAATTSCASALSNLKTATKVGPEYKELLSILATANSEVHALETRIKGFDETHIVQAPNLPATEAQPKKFRITAASAVATAFLLSLFILLREGMRQAKGQNAEKINRLRRALGLKGRA